MNEKKKAKAKKTLPFTWQLKQEMNTMEAALDSVILENDCTEIPEVLSGGIQSQWFRLRYLLEKILKHPEAAAGNADYIPVEVGNGEHFGD
jgi:hypothetical protein